MSIINFRVPPSFLALFPQIIEATITLLLPPAQSELVDLQYRPKDVQAILLSLPSTSLKRLTLTCTNLPVEILALASQRFPNLTHLSFVWFDAPDRISGGVETTDVTHILRQYTEAIAPLSNTLQALYLPACVGTPTTKYPATTLSRDDELLGEGPALLPAIDPIDGALSGGMGMGAFGYIGPDTLKHGRVSVGMKGLLDACRTLVKGVGPVKTSTGEVVGLDGMTKLEKVGWLIPQGDGMPLLPIECVRRKGVVKFGAAPPQPFHQPTSSLPSSIVNGVQAISISSGPRDTSKLSNGTASHVSPTSPVVTSPFSSTTYTPSLYAPRAVPIMYSNDPIQISPISPLSSRHANYYPAPGFDRSQYELRSEPTPARQSGSGYKEETEYWYPSMEWCDDCAWPAFSEIEAVFPRPECMRY